MLEKAATAIQKLGQVVAFTGAGISVESGIPPFRGDEGIWNAYDPKLLELSYFLAYPEESWKLIRKIFYEYFKKSKPNAAHHVLAGWEKSGLLTGVITQNIDNLHQDAGSTNIAEFHGNAQRLICMGCSKKYDADTVNMDQLPVKCPACQNVLKPDFVFFGENIPVWAFQRSRDWSTKAKVMLIIGSSGEVMPANQIPFHAKQHGAFIIEINTEESYYTHKLSDIFIQGKASSVLVELDKLLHVK